jgi:KRAB domain-containing zinc finger protein
MEGQTYLRCTYEGCDYTTLKSNTLRKHIRRHLPKAFKCDSCEYSCHTRSDMEIHVHKHTGDKPYACPREGCPYRSRKTSGITEHLRTHKRIVSALCECTLCPRKFLKQASLDTHVRRIHVEGAFNCEVEGCDFHGASATDLKTHCRRKHSPTDIPVKACALCTFTTTSARRMGEHVQANHGEGLLQLFDAPLLGLPELPTDDTL